MNAASRQSTDSPPVTVPGKRAGWTPAARSRGLLLAAVAWAATLAAQAPPTDVRPAPAVVPRFALPASGLELTRPTHPGAFLAAQGRRAAWLGYEHQGLEAWVYPLKVLEELALGFTIEGYPLEIPARDIAGSVSVRPEAAVLTYHHAAFTVRQVLFAPIDEPGLVMLLDVDTTLPLTISGTFRPRLRLMWPAGLMTQSVGWDAGASAYVLTEESNRFAAVIGAPGARDVSLMPYQEEPRDVPIRFVIDTAGRAGREFLPIVIAGSVKGRDEAMARYRALLGSIPAQYDLAVDHYARLARETVQITTPDERLNAAYAWARVGIDKGLATNPMLGTGLLAGFRTSGDSERPGFAWFFGRDALWTTLALTAAGDHATARTALEFLRKHQRDDGKIPHEVSQSASLLPWFTDYPYAWASSDATPLYVIAQADLWRATGDQAYLEASWPSIRKAYEFTRATDTDGNDLVENTASGHGWVEGGALYPAHEEVYLQGLWIRAQGDLAELADLMGDPAIAGRAREGAERTRRAAERTYWMEDRGFYAFATQRTPARKTAEPGPSRPRRQARLDALASAPLVDEDTVLPAVPLWWGLFDPARADLQIDHLGSADLATDWGARILSNRSELYDPLSYHYGSVWPLFTGWASMAAYAYGRPHVGYQALTATADLTWNGALGSITELLSGDFNTAFGRSSHHQIWSEAMVVAPMVRGLLGLDVRQGGRHLAFVPQLPAHWEGVAVREVVLADGRADVELSRAPGKTTITVTRRPAARPGTGLRLTLGTALPLDARIRGASVDGRPTVPAITRLGDVQRIEATLETRGPSATVTFTYVEGSDVCVDRPPAEPGAVSEGLRVLRSRAGPDALHLRLEGRAGRDYVVRVRTPARVGDAEGVVREPGATGDVRLRIRFEGVDGAYARRDIRLPLVRP